MSFDFGRYTTSGNYFKFQQVGDSVTGLIQSIVEGSDYGGQPIPVLELETDEGEVTVSASQVMLRAELAAVQPEVGDEVTITFIDFGEAQPGRNPAKLFEIEILV